MKKMNNKGFSLVELIIVIAIMAVLIGVMAPQFMKYVERSRKSTDIQNVEEMMRAVTTYSMDPNATTKPADAEKITFTNSSGTVTMTAGTGISAALTDAGLSSATLKSTQWFDSTNIIELEIDVDSNGVITWTESGLVDSDHSLIKGQYK